MRGAPSCSVPWARLTRNCLQPWYTRTPKPRTPNPEPGTRIRKRLDVHTGGAQNESRHASCVLVV
jgi:hypothetical protein